jgi:hypothetical protein
MKKSKYHKHHKHFVVFGNLLITYIFAGLIVLMLIFGFPEEKQKIEKESLWVPEEFIIYQDYIKTIGGLPQIYDFGTIEGTIISLNKSGTCPYKEKNCITEYYPNDWGIVKIDKIDSYSSYPEKTYKELQQNKEFLTHFILTARPTKIRYLTVYLPKSAQTNLEISSKQTITQEVESTKTIFKPLPKEEDYYVLTTKVFYQELKDSYIPSAQTINEKILPGLNTGDRFKAKIFYNGTLYVDEYKLIN